VRRRRGGYPTARFPASTPPFHLFPLPPSPVLHVLSPSPSRFPCYVPPAIVSLVTPDPRRFCPHRPATPVVLAHLSSPHTQPPVDDGGSSLRPGAAPPRRLRVWVPGSAYLPIPDNSLVSGCAGARIFPHSRSCQSLTTPWSERCGRFRHPRSPTPSQRLKLTSSQVTLPSGVCTHACLARPSCTARCTVGLMLRRGHAPVGCA
jgi:hypothetical protein